MNRLGRVTVILLLAAGETALAQNPAPGATAPLLLSAMTPCRLLDTREDGGLLASGESRTVTVWGHCGIPSTARAVILNVTVVPWGSGRLIVWGDASSRPTNPIVEYVGGVTKSSGTPIHLDAGELTLQAEEGDAEVILDVLGYFEETAGQRFHGILPCRVLDAHSLSSGQVTQASIPTACSIPENARGVVAVLTLKEATAKGHLTVYPAGTSNPGTSSQSFSAGLSRATGTVITLGPGGFDAVATLADSGTVNLTVDVTGYYR